MVSTYSDQTGLSPSEVEFLAENQDITIVPLQKMATLNLINVPLWLGMTLKKKGKCQVLPPDWLNVDHLLQKIEEEKSFAPFSALPFHFMEISHIILSCASDDIPQAEAVRTLIKDLRETRQAKAREGLRNLDPDYLQMDNLGLMEINEIRPFFTKAFDQLRVLHAAAPTHVSRTQDTLTRATLRGNS